MSLIRLDISVLVMGTKKSEFWFLFIFLVYDDTFMFGGFMALANFVPTVAKYEPRLLAISVGESYVIFPTFNFSRIQDLLLLLPMVVFIIFPQFFCIIF